MRRAVITEAEVLAHCLAYLRHAGVTHWRANTGAARLPGKGGRQQLVRFGVPGQSDILAVIAPQGRLLAIEVKRPGGRATAAQRAFQQNVVAAGGFAGVVHSVEELRALLSSAGVESLPEVQ